MRRFSFAAEGGKPHGEEKMSVNRPLVGLVMGLALLVLLPAVASAQSAISGTVTDSSGAVLPGATVEASSPVLIEQVRTVVSDGQGRYTIVQLRPGTYKLTATLTGFSTFTREGIELPSDFTATINVQLAVGSLQETLTVTGASPIVDVQSSAKTEVITRSLLDALPTPRNTQSFGYLAQGVRLSKPDVGGQQMMEQVNMRVHGASELHTTMQIDGMLFTPAFNDGAIQNYLNQAAFQEITFTTSSQLAEVAAGGVRMNMIPKDGGNTFSGAMYFGTTEKGWQADNLTPELRAKGLTLATGVEHIRDYNPAFGGPIMRNKLWFFSSFRYMSVNEHVANSYLPDGSPAVVDQFINIPLVRLTGQLTPKNKLSAFLDRPFKYKGHEFTYGIEPSRASRRRNPGEANYHNAAVKWTSTVTNRVLLEVGYSEVVERLHTGYQPDVFKTTTGWPRPANIHLSDPVAPGSSLDPWFTDISHYDLITLQRTVATTNYAGTLPDRHVPMAALSYVTGTHNFKVGGQWAFGQDVNDLQSIGDIEQANYRNGVPESVVVSLGPFRTQEYVRADMGLYAQDTWRLKRMTLNLGIRHEYFNSGIDPQYRPGNRWVAGRTFDRIDNLPNWHDWVPRLGFAYDVLGDGRTAIKGGLNKYTRPYAGSFAKQYNPLRAGGVTTDTRDWFDCALIPGTSTCDPALIGTPGYHDGIVEDNEVGPSNNKLFGIGASRRPAAGIRRPYNLEETVSVQHQLLPRLGVTFAWFRRQYYDLQGQQNLAITNADWIPFQVSSPLANGEMITIYNLDPAKRGLVDLLDYNSNINTHISNDYEASFTARLPHGGAVFGGWTAMKNVENNCDQVNPNGSNPPIADLYSSITYVYGGRFCDQTKLPMPYRSDYKLGGTYPLPHRFGFSANFNSFAGNMSEIVWNVPISAFPNGQRTQSTLVPLTAPGTRYLERWNQLDISGRRDFRIGRYTITPQIDVYNALNGAAIQTENVTFGSDQGKPQTILNGRLLRVVAQMKW
jgi:carboxypeptidase family protein